MRSFTQLLFEILRAIERATPEGTGEVGASILIATAVFGTRYLARRYGNRLGGSPAEAYLRLGLSAVVSLVTGIGVLLFIGVWGLLDRLRAAYSGLGVGDVGGALVLIAVVLGLTYTVTNFVGRTIEVATGSRGRISQHQREIVYRLTQVVLYSLAGLVIVGLFTQDLQGMLVGAGFIGIVVGMAARQTLGAALAGFVLMFSRPFEIGDWIEVGDHEGTVTDITIVDTRIQTFDGEYVVIPNDLVSSQSIVNRSRKGRLRIEVDVGVDYDADPEYAANVAKEAVRGLDEILRVPTPQVVLKQFGDSSVVLGVRVWIGDPSARRRWRARTAVIEAVKEAFEEESLKIPFPQRELMGREEQSGFVLAGDERPPERQVEDGEAVEADGGDE
ncbi:MAG: mechanosensitive ion channel family protein [Haloferacaceae archaeon]